jgi:ABC-type nitrate/sulfonate/bicarbonate transport system substrate-binding protein
MQTNRSGTGPLRRALALVAATLLPFAATGAFAQSADTVRHGVQIGALGALRVTLPELEAKYRLKYEFKDFRDSSAVMLAIEQGELDIGNTTVQHLVRAMEEGIPVVWVAGWGGGYNVLVSAKPLGVAKDDWKGLAELAKKRAGERKPLKFGVPTGSMQHLKLVAALKAAAINPDKDVEIVNVPFPTHPRAIEGGEVDFAMTLATFGALSIHSGKGALFAHLFGGDYGKEEVGFIVHRDLLTKRADYVERVVASHAEAIKSFMSDTAKQITLELKYLKLPEPVVAMVQRDFLRLNYKINMPDVALMARQMHEVGWAKKDHSGDLAKFVNFTLLQKATGESPEALSRW